MILVQMLRSKCGVPVPQLLTNELVEGFVDVSMQHRAAIAGTTLLYNEHSACMPLEHDYKYHVVTAQRLATFVLHFALCLPRPSHNVSHFDCAQRRSRHTPLLAQFMWSL
jgi:hypothetical protein